MGLTNKIKSLFEKINFKFKTSKQAVVKKTAAGLMIGAMGFTSLFGFTACSNQPEKAPVTDTSNEEIEMLKEMVQSLSLLASQLESSDEINGKIDALNARIAALEAKKNVEEATLAEAIEEVKGLITELQAEVALIKERLNALESTTVNIETVTNLENQLVMMKAKMAIQNTFARYHMSVDSGAGIMYTAPNGDTVAISENPTDLFYGYYSHKDNMIYALNDGYERFGVADEQKIYAGMAEGILTSDEGDEYKFDKEKSDGGNYVFVGGNGNSVHVRIMEGSYVSEIDVFDKNNNIEMSVEICAETDFSSALNRCKSVLKSIGIFESYKKSLTESLQYKYAEVLATMELDGKTHSGRGVFSGVNAASEQENGNGKSYSVITGNEIYACLLDENGNKVDEHLDSGYSYDVAQGFKDLCTPTSGEIYYTISVDDNTGVYTLTSFGDDNKVVSKIEICFNADLSIDCRVTFENEVLIYKIKKITLERYNEVFLRINQICLQAKEQGVDLSQ